MNKQILYPAADPPAHQIRPDLLGTVIPAEHGTLVRWAVAAGQPETPLHSHAEFEQITDTMTSILIAVGDGMRAATQDATRAKLAEQALGWLQPLVSAAGGVINGGSEADVDYIMNH